MELLYACTQIWTNTNALIKRSESYFFAHVRSGLLKDQGQIFHGVCFKEAVHLGLAIERTDIALGLNTLRRKEED